MAISEYYRAAYSLTILLILIVSFGSFFILKVSGKNDPEDCRMFFDDPIIKDPELYYWMENNQCCRHALKDNKIIEQCG